MQFLHSSFIIIVIIIRTNDNNYKASSQHLIVFPSFSILCELHKIDFTAHPWGTNDVRLGWSQMMRSRNSNGCICSSKHRCRIWAKIKRNNKNNYHFSGTFTIFSVIISAAVHAQCQTKRRISLFWWKNCQKITISFMFSQFSIIPFYDIGFIRLDYELNSRHLFVSQPNSQQTAAKR